MNIFDIYLDKIKKLVTTLNKDNEIEIPDSLNGINVDIPPPKFDCDISTNVAMVLAKINQKPPIDLANQLSELIKKDDKKIIETSLKTLSNLDYRSGNLILGNVEIKVKTNIEADLISKSAKDKLEKIGSVVQILKK